MLCYYSPEERWQSIIIINASNWWVLFNIYWVTINYSIIFTLKWSNRLINIFYFVYILTLIQIQSQYTCYFYSIGRVIAIRCNTLKWVPKWIEKPHKEERKIFHRDHYYMDNKETPDVEIQWNNKNTGQSDGKTVTFIKKSGNGLFLDNSLFWWGRGTV